VPPGADSANILVVALSTLQVQSKTPAQSGFANGPRPVGGIAHVLVHSPGITEDLSCRYVDRLPPRVHARDRVIIGEILHDVFVLSISAATELSLYELNITDRATLCKREQVLDAAKEKTDDQAFPSRSCAFCR
jgi:hypothetical protein